jgi:hypothetical protein
MLETSPDERGQQDGHESLYVAAESCTFRTVEMRSRVFSLPARPAPAPPIRTDRRGSPPLAEPLRKRVLTGVLVGLALASGAACDRAPSADSLKEWSQADHHSTDDDKGSPGGQAAQVARAAPGAAGRDDAGQLVELAWRQQCTTCHGSMGHGDGQMGPMVQAPDLTRADWQSKTTDAEMAAVIKGGRNRMPSFNFPDPVVAGLVARIRSLQAR